VANIEFHYWKLSDFRRDPRNARTHSKKQIAQIAASISAHGAVNPILVNPAGVVIAGHGRLSAAKSLGLEQFPAIVISGLTEAEERRLRIADNKIAMNAGWDLDLLRVELAEIEIAGLDLDITGFEVGELDVLQKVQLDPDEEAIPAVPVEPVSRTGDIWLCGDHRIGCGDLLDEYSLSTLMAGAQANAAFQDPPYNVSIANHAGGLGKIKHREFAYASGEMSDDQFEIFLTKTLGVTVQVSAPGAIHFICMDHHHADILMEAAKPIYGARLNIPVWVKSNAGMGALYRSQHELVFVYRVGDAPHRNNVELGRHGRNRTNVWNYQSVNSFGGSRQQDLALHPTVKPVALVADAIRDVTKRGEIVLDGFLGSGTTLIAAELTNRRAYALEIDPGYVDVALERWSIMTGYEPTLEATGQIFSDVARLRRGQPEPPHPQA